jgi:hypothetical protein
MLAEQRAAEEGGPDGGTPSLAAELEKGFLTGVADVGLPGEVADFSLGPEQLLIRSSRVLHAVARNDSGHGRFMHHWRFCPAKVDHHRFRFEVGTDC